MTSKEAIKKIMTILNFSEQKFFESKTEQGVAMKMEDELEVGKVLYVVTDEGMIPAPAGVHKMEDGTEIETDEMGSVSKIKMGDQSYGETEDAKIEEEKKKEDIKEDSMVEAKSGDLKLESPTFDVGETIDVVSEDGSKTPAPDGEHQLELKDSEGNEVKIRVMVKDGKIMERENVEEVSEEFSVLVEAFATTIKKLETKLEEMARKNEVLEAKFKKFSAEPAGSRVTNNSTINQETFSASAPSKLEGMRRLRESLSR
jgi:hypothetical protein